MLGDNDVVSLIVTDAPFWWDMLIVGEAVYEQGQGIYRNSPRFLLNFSANWKLLWNIKSNLKKGETLAKPQNPLLQCIQIPLPLYFLNVSAYS